MSPTDSANAIFPIDLGNAAAFDQNVFPLTYYKQEGNLNKGNFLIKATLEEMEKIREQGIDLNKNLDFIYDTRLNVEALKADKERLQDNRKTSRNLYLQTKNTSEKIRREDNVRVVPSTRMHMVDGKL
ncbi:hypothetical protein L210DRAFT_598255 [Boletus edulis BED1]|uniref:Uncharacterized protein n=1 Tax=Boletus edulis BED1 TaxID=1328754 RepID=A0AAD4BE03_BOLED|nr:hypothetical protein L210DRAFT_598255 [Boletus edulis BED1]